MTSRTNAARAARERRRQQSEAASVELAPGWRLRPFDDRNWCVEEQRGKSWKVRGYYGTAGDACRGAARMLLDRECRASVHRAVSVAELGWRIEDAEARLRALFQRAALSETGERGGAQG